MNTILIGTPYTIRWKANSNDESISLQGRDINFYLVTPKGVLVDVPEEYWHTSENNIIFRYEQDMQYDYGVGTYGVIMVENEDEPSETKVMIPHAFALTSCKDEVNDADDELESSIYITIDECISISDIQQIQSSDESEGENIISVILTDGRSKQFVVKNGKQGKQGPKFVSNTSSNQSSTNRPSAPSSSSEYDELLDMINGKQDKIDGLDDIIDGASKGSTALQPVAGMGLSHNDFTNELKTKVENSLIKPSVNGTAGQILSVGEDGATQWIDAPEPSETPGDGCTCEPYDDTDIKNRVTQLEQIEPVVINGDIVNNADEETLHADTTSNLIMLADWNNDTGLSYKILKKELSFASQVKTANTIYEIRHDYNLSNAQVSIPSNCVLKFVGGSISNGKVVLNDTKFVSDSRCFVNIEFTANVNGGGGLVNDEIMLNWFLPYNASAKSEKDKHYDAHDDIISAMKLSTCKKSLGNVRSATWINFSRIQLSVLSPLVIDNSWGSCNIKNANINFFSSDDKQSLFEYNYQYITQACFDNCHFNYSGGINGGYHSYINCIRFRTGYTTAYSYWRNIICASFTGYFFVNQTYIQQCTFDNIVLNTGGGFISYNSSEVFTDVLNSNGNIKKGSSNIVRIENCNVNGTSNTSEAYASCCAEYIWDFHNYMELTIRNAVSQGVGYNGQKMLILGTGNYAQKCVLDGFWVEYVSGKVDSRAYINGQCDLVLKKNNISGVVIDGDNRCINIFANNLNTDYYGNSMSFVDRSEIKNSSIVCMYIDTSVYSSRIKLSDKMIDWMNKGIIKSMRWKNYGLFQNQAMANMQFFQKKCINQKYVLARNSYISNLRSSLNAYFKNYNGLNILCIEPKQLNTGVGYRFEDLWTMRDNMFVELVYRPVPLIDVTEENKSTIKIGGSATTLSSDPLYVSEVGDLAEVPKKWMRTLVSVYNGVSNAQTTFYDLKNCRIEIAKYIVHKDSAYISDDEFEFDAVNGDLISKGRRTEVIKVNGNVPFEMVKYIIGDSNIILETDDNIYKRINGSVCAIAAINGTSSNRPQDASIGMQYYDTTINKPIWHKGGNVWVDANGNNV